MSEYYRRVTFSRGRLQNRMNADRQTGASIKETAPLPEEFFRKAFQVSPIPLGLCTLGEGRFLEANESLLQLLERQRDEVVGCTDLELGLWADLADRQRVFGLVAGHSAVQEVECCLRTKSGALRDALISLQRMEPDRDSCLLFVSHDITERVKAESQRRHSEKMEAVGHLAAGFAHDFNNILTVVQGHTSLLLLTNGQLDGQANKALQHVSCAADRAAALTRQLLTFGRRQILRPKTLQLNSVLQSLETRLQGLLGEDVMLRLHLAPHLPLLEADPRMMEEICINLAINAREAMPQGGHFAVRTEAVEIDAWYASAKSEARPGHFICLTVSDNGCGMDAATMNRLFEPFFTTKEVGKGPGLGLAAVYGIVKQHNGWTEVASQPGQGTTFKIFFPLKAPAAAAKTDKKPNATETPRPKTILVVEDESPLRSLVQSILRRSGYCVMDAANGVEALQVWEKNRGEFDLLLTDMVMPEGMSGRELAAKLQAQKPNLKVIYSSGYTLDLLGPGVEGLSDGVNFLQKPYRPQTLAQTVRACLEEGKN
jgi:two-component system cell cycle sensor histidine kinase/response regulator CckA